MPTHYASLLVCIRHKNIRLYIIIHELSKLQIFLIAKMTCNSYKSLPSTVSSGKWSQRAWLRIGSHLLPMKDSKGPSSPYPFALIETIILISYIKHIYIYLYLNKFTLITSVETRLHYNNGIGFARPTHHLGE